MKKQGNVMDKAENLFNSYYPGNELKDIEIESLKKENESLRQELEKFRTFFEEAPYAFYIHDPEGFIIEANRTAESQTGYRREELCSLNIFDDPVSSGEELIKLKKTLLDKPASSVAQKIEYAFKARNGSDIHLDLIKPANKKHASSFFFGISGNGSKRTDKNTIASDNKEEHYKGLFHNNHAVMLVLSPDDGTIIDANPAACKFYGYKHEEITRISIFKINVLPEQTISSMMHQALNGECTQFNCKHRLSSGEVRDMVVYCGPITFKGKKYLLSIIHDETNKISVEKALIKSLKSHKALLEAIPDIVIVMNRDGDYMDYKPDNANKRNLLPKDVIGKNIKDFNFPESSIPVMLDGLRKAADTGGPVHLEYDYIMDDSTISYECRLVGMSDKLIMGIVRENTDTKAFISELENKELKYRTLFETINDPILIVEEKSDRIIESNPAASSVYGYSDEELKQMVFGELFVDKDKARYIALRDKKVKLRFRHKSKDGSEINVEIFTSSIDLGGVRHLIMIVRDVTIQLQTETELKLFRSQLEEVIRERTDELTKANIKLHQEIFERQKAENELKFKEELIRAMNDASPLALLAGDYRNDSIMYFNSKFCDIWKIRHFEERMRKGEVKNSELLNYCIPLVADIPAFIESIKQIQDEENMSVTNEMFSLIDGRILRRISAPISDENNRFHGRLFIFEDMTEQGKATEELMKSEARIRALLDNIPYVVWFKDTNSRYIAANRTFAEFFNVSLDDISGKTDFELLPLDLAERYSSSDLEVMITKRQELVEEPMEINGKVVWLETFKKPVVDSNGNVIGTTGLTRDITKRKISDDNNTRLIEELQKNKEKMEKDSKRLLALNTQLLHSQEQLRQLNASKDKFFSIIAHDLRGAFAGSLSMAELLELHAPEMERSLIASTSSGINASLKQLYGLLSNLLEWSRSQMGLIEIHPAEHDLRFIIDRNIALMEATALKKDIKIVNNVPEKHFVHVDVNVLSTVTRNLLSNALKYSNRNAVVIVSSMARDGFAHMSVADNGIGMEDDVINKIFRIETKYSMPGTENEKGTGLGLILCKELMEKSNGAISVESKQGTGSIFTVKIPLPAGKNHE